MRRFFAILFVFYGCAASHQTTGTIDDSFIVSETASQAVVSSNVIVNPPSQIFGANGQVNFNRVFFDDTGLQKAIDSLHLDAIRYPGGTIAEYFNWRTDTPSVYSVAALKNYTKIPYIFIVLNTKTSTLQEQLNWLSECHAQGLFADSLICEIGNEYEEAHDDNFLNKCANYANVLKSQYPKARLAVPGGAPSKWNKKVLDRIPGVYLVDHYHNPVDYTKNGITDTAAIDSMMRADKRKYFPGVPTSRIMVTEFNLQTDKNVTPVFASDEQKSLAVSYMFGWFRSHGFAAVLMHNIVMAQGNGMIESDARGSRRTATGQGFINFRTTIR